MIVLVDAIALLLVDLRGRVDWFSLLVDVKLGLVETLNPSSRWSLALLVSIQRVILGVVLLLLVLGHRLVLLLVISSLLVIGNVIFILHHFP